MALAAARPVATDKPSLATVLERAAAYVADFHRQLSSIVAEERYVQDWKTKSPSLIQDRGTADLQHRVLLSDLLLVKPGGDAGWMEFRDVFDVDGRPVHERSERLVKMFLEPSPSTARQISRILNESARFNIGDIDRNVNTPVFPLQFLEAANQPRFRFKQTGDRRPKTTGATAASNDGAFRSPPRWAIAYDERQVGYHDQNSGTKGSAVARRLLDRPASGRVFMASWRSRTATSAVIDVSFQSSRLGRSPMRCGSATTAKAATRLSRAMRRTENSGSSR
jgi:hypothetical protein